MRAIDIVRRLCPGALGAYVAAFEAGDEALASIGGIDNVAREDAFLANVLHETDGLTIRVESLNYSAPRLAQVWPSRFKDPAVAAKYAHAPKALAEHTYGGRMGNGPEGSGDGWKFIGRGLLQITGREAYEKYGMTLGIDLAGNPDLAVSADWALKIAAAEWAASTRRGKTCNEMADAGDFEGVVRAINGGLIGLPSRKAWLRRIRAARAALDGTAKPLTRSRTMGGVGLVSTGVVVDQGAQSIGDTLGSVADQLAPAAAVSDRIASIVAVIKAVGSLAVVAGLAWAAYARWDDAGRPMPGIAPDWLARLVGGHKAQSPAVASGSEEG